MIWTMQVYRLSFTLSLSFFSVTGWLVSQSIATAQEYPGCFMIVSSGQVVELNELCERDRHQAAVTASTVQTLLEQGRDLVGSGRYQEAIAKFTRAINLAPDNLKLYIVRAATQRLAGDERSAISDFEQAAELSRQRGESGTELTQELEREAEEARKSI